MKRLFFTVCVSVLLMLSAHRSYADFDATVCFSGCNTEHAACMADALNDLERSRCNTVKSDCVNRCDAERENDAREKREKFLQQQQEQPPQEPAPQEPPSQDQQDQPPQDQQ